MMTEPKYIVASDDLFKSKQPQKIKQLLVAHFILLYPNPSVSSITLFVKDYIEPISW